MPVIYDKILKPILFAFDAEDVHHFVNHIGENLGRFGATRWAVRKLCRPVRDSILETELAGVKLTNPLGVGAGFDKEGREVSILQEVGFGFVEVGTITGHPSPGNPRPRLWRLPEDRALVVNYGLLSSGADAARIRFASYRKRNRWEIPVGVSVAKSNVTGLSGDAGFEDLISAFRKLEPYADYMTVNVSCPNTGDGEQYCKDPAKYREVLNRLDNLNPDKPVFFKISPDITTDQLMHLMQDTDGYAWAKGFVLTNLTHDRDGLKSKNLLKASAGGVSGRHLKTLSEQALSEAYKNGKNRFQFIGIGGIDSVEDAYRRIRLGASAIQIVTSLIYNGPLWPARLTQGLAKCLKRDGFKSVKEAVGVDSK